MADSSQSATKKKMEDLEQRTKSAEEDMLQCQRRLDEQIMKNRKLQTMLEESDFRLKTLNHDIAVGEVDLDEYGNQSIICELIFLLSGSLRKGFQSMEKRLKALSAKFFKSSTSTEPVCPIFTNGID